MGREAKVEEYGRGSEDGAERIGIAWISLGESKGHCRPISPHIHRFPMIKPFAQDDDFLADVETSRASLTELHIWWLGQSGFLVQWEGRHLLLDPYLSDSLTKKYANTDKPHIRMTERVVAPESLNFIDVVTSSHSHTDHLDAETLK